MSTIIFGNILLYIIEREENIAWRSEHPTKSRSGAPVCYETFRSILISWTPE
jgi:hypothetical protein